MGCWLYQILCFLFAFLNSSLLSLSSSLPPPHLCHPEQSSALLKFKSSFSISVDRTYCGSEPFHITDSSLKTDPWDETTDCCRWDGVTCDNKTGNVIGLDLSCSGLMGSLQSNSSLFSLQKLQWLNLADNNFNFSKIASQFSKLRSLTYLNLSNTRLSGFVTPKISLLSKLVSLDLSFTNLRFRNHDFNMLVHNLTRLENLILDFVNLSMVVPNSFLNLTVSLKHLSLDECQLQGNFPVEVFLLPSLEKIILTYNDALIGFLPKTNWSNPLSLLDLSGTSFSELPDTIGNLKNLEELGLSSCNVMGSIPSTLGNLTKVTFLDFSYNHFQGQIPDVFGNFNDLSSLVFSHNNFSGFLPSSTFNLTSLTYMDFSYNLLQGTLPNNVSGLSNLKVLRLSANLLTGRVPGWLFSIPSLQSLDLNSNKLIGPIDAIQEPNLVQDINLSNNEIHGPIASSFFELVNLTDLDLSSNNLSGNIKSCMLVKLRNLERLDLSYNSLLSLSSCSNDVNSTLPMLFSFLFSSSNMQRFPSFLNASKNLNVLDLSNNKIQGSILKWEAEGWENLVTLNLSLNFLTGVEHVPGKHLAALDLRSNSLQGPLPAPPQTLRYFLVSDNELVGEIPYEICNLSSLVVLDLSNNKLGAIIPDCLGNFSYQLSVVDLRMNYFHGKIPRTYLEGGLLRSLNLNGNQLEGPIPQSLVNCSRLEVLDLGNNNLNDTFPYWLGTLSHLQVLGLRSNRFHGDIQSFNSTSSFSSLRMLDLSRNQFSGHIPPKLFENFNAMREIQKAKTRPEYMGEYYYQDSVIVTMKGFDIKLVRILTIFTIIDFSSNHFQGPIPEVVGELNSLIVLNFSHNSLTGNIPPTIGILAALESLDLSSNKLEGRIPEQLTELTFLGVLNLSQNNLAGPIPLANHFDTFTNDSFDGNPGLCGFPLTKKCGNDVEPESPASTFGEDYDSATTLTWEIALMGYGCGLVFGLSMGYIVFTTGRPRWLVKMIERKPRKIIRTRIHRNGGRKN